jgi:hypothetical protein
MAQSKTLRRTADGFTANSSGKVKKFGWSTAMVQLAVLFLPPLGTYGNAWSYFYLVIWRCCWQL